MKQYSKQTVEPSKGMSGSGMFAASLVVMLLAVFAARAGVVYVAPTGDDANNGSYWGLAKRTIQAGIDEAPSNGVVRVAAGTYNTGGRRANGGGAINRVTNRVVITRGISVIAEEGPDVTFIVGEKDWTDPNYGGDGESAIRGVWMGTGTRLVGFTITNGATRGQGDDTDGSGGGIWCEDHTVVISNCVLIGNSTSYGGAVRRGTLYGCVISNNTASSQGGGLFESVAYDTVITHNFSGIDGGGAFTSTLHRCTIVHNVARNGGVPTAARFTTVWFATMWREPGVAGFSGAMPKTARSSVTGRSRSRGILPMPCPEECT